MLRFGMALLALALGAIEVSAQEPYRLEANDRIEIWTSAEPSLQRVAVIGPDGWLSLPLVGHIQAAGATMPELEQRLQERLKGFFKDPVDLTVMLQPGEERTQTIYVTGEVTTPGAYPYRPGMILLHGVSMAGGLRREEGAGTEEQRILETRSAIANDSNRIDALDAQIARVHAEMVGTDLGQENVDRAMQRERGILAARRSEEAILLRARDEAVELRRETTDAIRKQGETQATRIQLAEKRLKSISQLVAKGFAHEAQLLELQSGVEELKAGDLELQVTLYDALRETSADVLDTETALKERQTLLALELRDAERERDVVKGRVTANTALLSLLSDIPVSTLVATVPGFAIIRSVNGQSVEQDASEFSNLQPGDLIRVRKDTGASGNIVSNNDRGLAAAADTLVQ